MVQTNRNNNWHGWFIEQSFDDQEIFQKYPTVKMKSEEEDWKEHVVEIADDELDTALNWLQQHIKPAWYAHLVKGNELVVIYKDKEFRVREGGSFEGVDEYGRSLGIKEGQLPSEKLFKLARDSGF